MKAKFIAAIAAAGLITAAVPASASVGGTSSTENYSYPGNQVVSPTQGNCENWYGYTSVDTAQDEMNVYQTNVGSTDVVAIDVARLSPIDGYTRSNATGHFSSNNSTDAINSSTARVLVGRYTTDTTCDVMIIQPDSFDYWYPGTVNSFDGIWHVPGSVKIGSVWNDQRSQKWSGCAYQGGGPRWHWGTGDFNGDGYDDIVSVDKFTITIYRGPFNSTTGCAANMGQYGVSAPAGSDNAIYVGDFNNDNKDDILNIRTGASDYIFEGSAAGFNLNTINNQDRNVDQGAVYPYDRDGDGRDDYNVLVGGTLYNNRMIDNGTSYTLAYVDAYSGFTNSNAPVTLERANQTSSVWYGWY